MTEQNEELLLTPKEKEKVFEDFPCLDPSFEDDYKTEVELLLEAQANKAKKQAKERVLKIISDWYEMDEEEWASKYGRDATEVLSEVEQALKGEK